MIVGHAAGDAAAMAAAAAAVAVQDVDVDALHGKDTAEGAVLCHTNSDQRAGEPVGWVGGVGGVGGRWAGRAGRAGGRAGRARELGRSVCNANCPCPFSTLRQRGRRKHRPD